MAFVREVGITDDQFVGDTFECLPFGYYLSPCVYTVMYSTELDPDTLLMQLHTSRAAFPDSVSQAGNSLNSFIQSYVRDGDLIEAEYKEFIAQNRTVVSGKMGFATKKIGGFQNLSTELWGLTPSSSKPSAKLSKNLVRFVGQIKNNAGL